MSKKIWKMIVSDNEYEKIIQETQKELREINQDHLINFSQ